MFSANSDFWRWTGIDTMENLNGHEAGNGGYSQGDTCRRRWSLAYSAAIASAAKTLNKTPLQPLLPRKIRQARFHLSLSVARPSIYLNKYLNI
jgi:hypothetical protein